MAWLHAPINPPKGAKNAEPGKSRGRQLADDGQEWPLPELEDGMHLVHALLEVGPFGAGGMGPSPVSWQEIEAWKRSTASALHPHELGLLRQLSQAYLEQWLDAKDRNCPSPELIKPEGEKAKSLARRIKGVLRG